MILLNQIRLLSEEFFSRYSNQSILLFEILTVAEDRRARWHFGIDPISIIRAFLVAMRTGRVSGVSTIEQQLVRTLRPRSQSPIRSKPLELALSACIGLCLSKRVIWSAYLYSAYYGSDWDTFDQVVSAVAVNSHKISPKEACDIVAYLKYPKPEGEWPTWDDKHKNRSIYILKLYGSCGRL